MGSIVQTIPNLPATKGRAVKRDAPQKITTYLSVPTRCGSLNRDYARLGCALVCLLFLVPCNLHGQVPGICTQPDGLSWPMSTEPNAGIVGVSALHNRLQRNDQNQKPMDTAALKSFLNRTDHNEVKAIKPIVNRYAPHSVHNSNPSQFTSQPLFRGQAFSTVGNRTAITDDDNLLAPISTNVNDDLLAPSNTPSANSDPLSSMGPDAAREQQRSEKKTPSPTNGQAAIDPHLEAFANEEYPSALTCAKCHQKIYDEWRVSGHAYAAVSPMFQRFEQAVAELVRGTSGTFCVRCHAPVATQVDHPREAPIFSGPAVFREGITCVACHRVVERYGRVNGERRIETGSPYDPVVGSWGAMVSLLLSPTLKTTK